MKEIKNQDKVKFDNESSATLWILQTSFQLSDDIIDALLNFIKADFFKIDDLPKSSKDLKKYLPQIVKKKVMERNWTL